MFDIITEIILYTFFTFGVIVFLTELANDLKHIKNKNKIIFILDDDNEDFERVFREISYLAKKNGIKKNVYIFIQNRDENISKIAETIVNKDNIKIIDEEELLKFTERK